MRFSRLMPDWKLVSSGLIFGAMKVFAAFSSALPLFDIRHAVILVVVRVTEIPRVFEHLLQHAQIVNLVPRVVGCFDVWMRGDGKPGVVGGGVRDSCVY